MKFLGTVERIIFYVGAILILVLAFMTIVDISFRIVSGRSLIGMYPLAELTMVAIVYLGLSYTESAGGHINVDLVTSKMPSSAQKACTIFVKLLSFVVFAIILWRSFPLMIDSLTLRESTPGDIHFPMFPFRVTLVVGVTLICIRHIVGVINTVLKVFSNSYDAKIIIKN